MTSKEALYDELYAGEDQKMLEIIEAGLRKNKDRFRFYYHNGEIKVPPCVMNKAINHITELGYAYKVGIEVNKGKFLEVIL